MIYIVNSIRISIEPDCEASKSFEFQVESDRAKMAGRTVGMPPAVLASAHRTDVRMRVDES